MSEGESAPRDGTSAWHRRLNHTGHDQLSEDTAQTPGMRRYEAISGARNGSRRVETGPGDYVYVPPFVPHREENPSADKEAVVVLARSTQEGIVVNLSSLRAEVPELDRLIAELSAGDAP